MGLRLGLWVDLAVTAVELHAHYPLLTTPCSLPNTHLAVAAVELHAFHDLIVVVNLEGRAGVEEDQG